MQKNDRPDVLDNHSLWPRAGALDAAGLNKRVAEKASDFLNAGQQLGRIARIDYGGCQVVIDSGRFPAFKKLPRVRREDQIQTDLAVGDWVAVETNQTDSSLVICSVATREGVLFRRDPSSELLQQVLAANIQAVLIVHAVDRPLRPSRLERAITLAHEGDIAPIVVASKCDLDSNDLISQIRARTPNEVPVHTVSTNDRASIDRLCRALPAGGTTALLGESGAGKSSLVNAMASAQLLATGDVRESDSKGRHTTTARELVPLGNGTCLLDTPGTRELGLSSDSGGIDLAFQEIAAAAANCRFSDCKHQKEAGCAVVQLANEGEILPLRLTTYHELKAEVAEIEQKRVDRVRRLGEGRKR